MILLHLHLYFIALSQIRDFSWILCYAIGKRRCCKSYILASGNCPGCDGAFLSNTSPNFLGNKPSRSSYMRPFHYSVSTSSCRSTSMPMPGSGSSLLITATILFSSAQLGQRQRLERYTARAKHELRRIQRQERVLIAYNDVRGRQPK